MGKADIVLTAEDAVEWEDKLVFVPREMNLVCLADLNTHRIDIIDSIPEEAMWGYRLCSKIVRYKEQLYFIPMNGEKIWKLDMRSHGWDSIEIENGKLPMKMMQAVIHQNILVMIGCGYPAILCMDLENKKISYIKEPFHKLKKNVKSVNDTYFRCDYVQTGETILLACCLDNSVLKLDLNSFKWEFVKVGNKENKYSGIAWDGCHYWLSPRKFGSVVRWDGDENAIELSIPYGEKKETLLYAGVCCAGGKVIFPAKDGRYTLEIDVKEPHNVRCVSEQYLFYKKTDEGKIIYGKPDGELAVFCMDGTVKRMKCAISFADVLIQCKIKEKPPFAEKIMESTNLSLREVILLVIEGDRENRTNSKKTGIGEMIWNRLTN